MIETYYTDIINTYRLQTTSGDKKAPVLYLENIPCHIQPYSGDTTQDVAGSFGKEFSMFCAASIDIVENDHIVCGDKRYRITAIERFKFRKQCRHQELRLRIFE